MRFVVGGCSIADFSAGESFALIFQRHSVKDFAKARIAPERVKDWVHAHLQRAIVLAAEKEKRPVVHVSSRKKWVELQGTLCLRNRFVESAEIRKAQTIMRVEVTKIRI